LGFVSFVCFVVINPFMPLTKAQLQRLRSLREKKHREELGLFVVEGEKVVAEILAAGNAQKFYFEELYATRPWIKENPKAADYLNAIEVSFEEMARISHFPTPSNVLAMGKISRTPLALGALDRGLTLALDGVQDAGNVGTLLRIADWFGLDRVVLSPDCADLFHQKVINASMGSFARVAAHTAELGPVLAATKVPVLGCDLAGDDVHGLSTLRDAVIVVGSEGSGLSPAVKKCVTRYVTIPRFGGAESLNAAVAAAIVCDNLRRVAKA
jgi:TrmH family RNA methyltransferase